MSKRMSKTETIAGTIFWVSALVAVVIITVWG